MSNYTKEETLLLCLRIGDRTEAVMCFPPAKDRDMEQCLYERAN